MLDIAQIVKPLDSDPLPDIFCFHPILSAKLPMGLTVTFSMRSPI
jgi:hypothetical protein